METRFLIAPASPANPSGVRGVDMLANPLTLGDSRVASMVNLRAEEGVIKTRPAFIYQKLGVSGQFQGALNYSPSVGVSSRQFASPVSALLLVVDGKLHSATSSTGELPGCVLTLSGTYDFSDLGPVTMFQAENWLVLQNPFSDTYFWDGYGPLRRSPGMATQRDEAGECDTMTPDEMIDGMGPGSGVGVPRRNGTPNPLIAPHDPPRVTSVSSVVPGFPYVPVPSQGCAGGTNPAIDGGVACANIGMHSHDSFSESKHLNWLVNGASLGVYAHGRIHQDANGALFVSDLIHKRGYMATDDVLKMEEQSLESMGDPLSVSTRLGKLVALAIMPAMSTGHGEGDLIGYCEGGVVSFETYHVPRETRLDADGSIIQKGWDQRRLTGYLLNTVSAVGPNAVAVMPRDHFFRSAYGLHFLKTVLGEGTFAPEHLNLLSQPVQPVLNADQEELLHASATGVWLRGGRLFATVGLHEAPCHAAVGLAAGFVSVNQAASYTEDRTPVRAVEGVWVLDHGMQGVHHFMSLGVRPDKGTFGFLASDRDADVYFATLNPDFDADERDGDRIPIEWSLVTGCWSSGSRRKLVDAILECEVGEGSAQVRVQIRTDRNPAWQDWAVLKPDKFDRQLRTAQLGQPPERCREATWFQARLEGIGYAEIRSLKLSLSDTGGNAGQEVRVPVKSCSEDIFLTNREPAESRWTLY